MAEGDTKETMAARVKVQLTIAEWDSIKVAITTRESILVNARREVLLGYHYSQHKQSHLENEKSEIRKSQESVSTTSKPFRAKRSKHHIPTAPCIIGMVLVYNLEHAKRSSLS
jgi:hypothetical protein